MGFGHRVYRAYDPRAAALRAVAEGMAGVADWLDKAVAVEEIALRVLAEFKPDYPIKTNVEYYAAAVLQGVGLAPNLFPATFALARHAGWTAHCLEQAEANVLIRPDVRYVGPAERHLPGLAAQALLQQAALRGILGQLEGATVRDPGLVQQAAAAEQLPASGVVQVVAIQPVGERVERREPRLRAVALGKREPAIQGDDRRRLEAIQRVVERHDLVPRRVLPSSAPRRG